MSFRRRNYPEVLDNLLTTLVGGVAAETHPFPPSDSVPRSHPLLLRVSPEARKSSHDTGSQR